MPRFSSAKRQAATVMKSLQGRVIRSVGTVRNYEQALIRVTEYLKEYRLGALEEMTPQRAIDYLEHRSQEVGQKALDMERQAIQTMMQHLTRELTLTSAYLSSNPNNNRPYSPERTVPSKSDWSAKVKPISINWLHRLLTVRV